MQVAIVGGTGSIGNALIPHLMEAGHSVTLVTRRESASPPPSLRGEGLRVSVWDPARKQGQFPEGVEAVINLAGAGIADRRWTAARKAVLWKSRVDQAGEVLGAMRAVGARVLLQASAVGIYGDCGDDSVDEGTGAGAGFLAELTQGWEAAVAGAEGIRTVLLRTGNVLSRRGGVMGALLPLFRWGVGGVVGSGRQGFPWIHIEDEVGAILYLLESESASGAFNLVAPGIVDQAAFTKSLGKALHRPTLLPVPAWLLRLVLGERSSLLLEGARVVPRHLLDHGYSFRFPELPGALADLLRV